MDSHRVNNMQGKVAAAQATFGKTAQIDTSAERVLADTYKLLSMSILFAAVMATASLGVLATAPSVLALTGNIFVFLGVFWFCTYMVTKNQHKPSGVLWMFATAGWLGFGIGPMLAFSLSINGFGPLINALACTGLTLLVSSAVGRRQPGVLKLSGFVATGILVAFAIGMINVFFFNSSAANLVVMAAFGLLSPVLISIYVAGIVHGGERSHVLASLGIFVALYNLFSIFLALFSSNE